MANAELDRMVQEFDKFMRTEFLKDPNKYSCGHHMSRVYELGYIAGQAMERRLLRLKLGLSVPSDSEDS